ncbi:MAG: hypothetical protein II932_02120 [Treponema sp.]|nr:hypothetical protein [Treponema sp.]
MNMSLTEFDQEEYDRNRRREGREEGISIGENRGRQETARNLLGMGVLSCEQIAQATGLPLEDISRMSKAL